MDRVPQEIAAQLVEDGPGGMEDLRVHMFEDDLECHDDEAVAQIHDDFLSEFAATSQLLNEKYGEPVRTGDEDDADIPLNGVLKFAIWTVGEVSLYLAVAHEDRETPVLLMMGTVE